MKIINNKLIFLILYSTLIFNFNFKFLGINFQTSAGYEDLYYY